MCKRSDALSRPVLMLRGLDGYFDFPSDSLAAVRFSGPGARPPVSPLFGGYSEGETPLPIPNRAVKPLSADGTWPSRAWESRSPPALARRATREGGPSAFWSGPRATPSGPRLVPVSTLAIVLIAVG